MTDHPRRGPRSRITLAADGASLAEPAAPARPSLGKARTPLPSREPRLPGPRSAGSRLGRCLEGEAFVKLRFACDLTMLSVAAASAVWLSSGLDASAVLVLYPPLALALLGSRGRYRRRLREVMLDPIVPAFGAMSVATMTIFMGALLAGGDPAHVGLLVARTWVASLVLVTAGGLLLTLASHVARRRGIAYSPTLIAGHDEGSLDIARKLQRHPEYGLWVVGFLAEPPVARRPELPPVLGRIDDLADIVTEYGIRHVIVGFPQVSRPELLTLTKRCSALGVETTIVPRLVAAITRHTQTEYIGTAPLMSLRETYLTGWQLAAKHGIDRVIAGVALLGLAPLMLLIAAAVRLSSPGPVLFRQLRAGRDGQAFELLKFRTMVDLGEQEFALPPGLAPGGIEGIDRCTRVGRLLRRTSFDELPQLINVLRGEMSLVGPRPERPEYVERFRRDVDRYHERHRVRAGITGWAQVHGLRGQTPVIDRVELDNFYIEHWSLALDAKIMLLTLPALLRGS